jgi:hypothetical protein
MAALSFVNHNEQRLQFEVVGNSTLLSFTPSAFAPGNGLSYLYKSYTFVANSPVTTITFRDVSPTTQNIDLVLDNVRVTPQSSGLSSGFASRGAKSNAPDASPVAGARNIGIEQTGHGVLVRFAGAPGAPYRIQRSESLAAWTSLAERTASGDGLIEFEDEAANPARGFYRAVSAGNSGPR